MSTVESIARPRRNGERRRAPTASISKESPAITGVVEMVIRRPILENEKTVTQFCRKLAAERPLKDIRDEYNYPKKKGIKDECSRLLEASTMKSRRGFAIQRLMNAMRQAHADGWFIVFDTLTLADDRLEAFYDNPSALRDYFRDIGRMV